MRVIILHAVELDGVKYTPQPVVQDLPKETAQELIDQKAARAIDPPRPERKFR